MTATELQAAAAPDGPSGTAVSLIVGLALCVYFLPSIIAIKRHVNLAYVLIINLFFGWTFLGWISALISACAHRIYIDAPQINNYYQISSAATGPAAGWYIDPNYGERRYWDGLQWTQNRQATY